MTLVRPYMHQWHWNVKATRWKCKICKCFSQTRFGTHQSPSPHEPVYIQPLMYKVIKLDVPGRTKLPGPFYCEEAVAWQVMEV